MFEAEVQQKRFLTAKM